MPDDSKLDALRKKIDTIDADILSLISERAGIVKEVGCLKKARADDMIFYRPEREAQILRKIMQDNQGPLSDQKIACLFRKIISVCFSLEQTLKIAYLGPEGTFTQSATLKHFGQHIQMTALNSIDQVFREVSSGACQYGVVPRENSIEGAVNHTLDMFMDSDLIICGEIELPINHYLLSHAASPANVAKVYSHQQSLAQCRIWLDTSLPTAERIEVNSNAKAVQIVIGEKNSAAIAGEFAAEFYQVPILARNIESDMHNTTRFLVLGQQSVAPSGDDKTSLMFTAPNKSGALQAMLACFANNDVSLTHIESRPSRKGMWDYVFFADIVGHQSDTDVAIALDDLSNHASMVKLLGSYPRAV